VILSYDYTFNMQILTEIVDLVGQMLSGIFRCRDEKGKGFLTSLVRSGKIYL